MLEYAERLLAHASTTIKLPAVTDMVTETDVELAEFVADCTNAIAINRN